MEKASVIMKNWELTNDCGRFNLEGVADRHPAFGANAPIQRTSSLVNYCLVDDILEYETRNTKYLCPLKFMRTAPLGYMEVGPLRNLLQQGESSECILDKIIAIEAKLSLELLMDNTYAKNEDLINSLREIDFTNDKFYEHIKILQKAGQQEIERDTAAANQKLMDIALQYEDSIYIEMSNVGCGNTLAYHISDYAGVIEPMLHSGMWQDSVLYVGCVHADDSDGGCRVDFRYFPYGFGNSIKVYSWSENIKQAVIKNDTNQLMLFNDIQIAPGETGVFSRDCYTGANL